MAQSTPSFDKAFAESLCDLQVPKAIRFSPDGQKLVYSTSLLGGQRKGKRIESSRKTVVRLTVFEGKNHVSTLWLAKNEANSSRKLTSGNYNDTSPTWHPRDNSRIAFLSDRAKPVESSAIWLLSLEGGDPLPLTKEDNEQTIDAYAFSPDGKTIAYVSPDEKEKTEDDEEEPEVWDEKWDYAKLRLLDVETLETKVLLGNGLFTFLKLWPNIGEIAWSPDGQSLVFMSTLNPHIEEAMLTGTSIAIINVTTGAVRHLCKVMNEPYNLIWAPDGKIYFITGTFRMMRIVFLTMRCL
jgi:Tol biopolymer transport system component